MINKKRLRLKILLLLNILFSAFLILLTNIKENGIIEVNRLKAELIRLEQKIDNIGDENRKLEDEIYSLKNDTLYIEKIAREELGLVKHGETVFEFVKK